MKLVDEKGKLFGKLNIIDLLVVILVIAAAAVLAVKFFGGSEMSAGGNAGTLTYTVRVMEVDQATYENVCQFVDSGAGRKDQLFSNGALIDGYVVDVVATEHVPTASDKVGGNTLDLLFTIEAVPSDALTGAVGTQEVRIGKSHIVKTVHMEFTDGVIMTCQWDS